MEIQLYNMKEFIEINQLKEIKSPILFSRGGTPDPEGLISNEIFGVNLRSRKSTFAYIKLYGHFFHPHIYKIFKRLYRNIEKIINGSFYYSIDKNGYIYEDNENGMTGLESIYENWEKIKWKRSEDNTGMRNERIDLLTKTKKDDIFIEEYVVIPAFYRDIKMTGEGKGETDQLNNLYTKLIRLSSLLESKDMFDFTLYSTYYNLQGVLVEIYDEFKRKLEKKNGMIRKFLMGKNIDYCTRSVISTPNFHADNPREMLIDFEHIGAPISQVCSLCYPFMVRWLHEFFENEFITNKETKIVQNDGELVSIKNPESIFTDEYIKKMMDRYIRNPECRFDPITVPLENGQTGKVAFTGMILDPNDSSEQSTLASRPLTITDILYMAAVDVTKDKHALITRYPVSDSYGIFLGKVRVISTLSTCVMKVNSTVYKFYPVIDFNIPKLSIATRFIDTFQFSEAYLKGIGGDYDGDQITAKILWTQEANQEIEKYTKQLSYFITPSGKNIRVIEKEAVQTLFSMTKNPNKNSRRITPNEKQELLSIDVNNITFSTFTRLFSKQKEKNGKVTKQRFNTNDILTLNAGEWHSGQPKMETTVGRLILNKYLLDSFDLYKHIPYINTEMTDGVLSGLEKTLANLLQKNKITTDQMVKYINYRDWFGMKIHPIITSSFTPATIKTPPEVKKLKQELLKTYKEELDNGDNFIAEKIEKELIAKTEEVLDGDPGLDLYHSGARGSIDNNLKNIILMKGAILNPITGKYDIVRSSLMDDIQKSELPAFSNSVVLGSYPKAVRKVPAA